MLMSPVTRMPLTASPGCSDCSHPGAGLELVMVLAPPPPATVMPICSNSGANVGRTFSANPAKFSGVSMGTMLETGNGLESETRSEPGAKRFPRKPRCARRLCPGVRALEGCDSSNSFTSSISSMGVMPHNASGEKVLKRSAMAPTSLPSIYTGLPLMPAATLVRWPLPPSLARITSCLGPH